MDAFLHQVASGIATGGIYAAVALALVMIYQSTHHINFAQGEMAMFSTYISWQLMTWGLSFWVAFAAAAAALGERLSVHHQPNLGGSGGYSRVMYEALKNTDCEQILFMDDDIRIEPDSILRALALSRFAKRPTLIGGQMLNLQEPSHLHVMGEVVNRANFMWTNAPFTEYDHDFAKYPLTSDDETGSSALLHRRIDVVDLFHVGDAQGFGNDHALHGAIQRQRLPIHVP